MLLRVLCVIIQSPCPLHVFYLILKSPNSYYENPEIYIMMQPILICTVYINKKCIYIIKLLIRWYMHYLIIINNLTILYGKYKNSQSHIKVTHLFYPNSPTSNILCHPSPPPPLHWSELVTIGRSMRHPITATKTTLCINIYMGNLVCTEGVINA